MTSALSRLNTIGTPVRQAPTVGFTPHPDYDSLPDAIKLSVTPKEFSWMTDQQRANLITECCDPDVEG